MSAVRLYAVAATHGTGLPRVRGTEAVAFRDLVAVVAPAPAGVESGVGAPPADLADYRRVVESVFRERGALPAPPGVVFRSRDLLAQWLELHYFTLLDALAFVEDRAVARVAIGRDGHRPGEEATMDEAAETVLQDALRVLRRQAVAAVAAGTDGSGHVTAMSFLVERAGWDAFAALAERERGRLADFTFALSGPWPPYDFVRMQFDS